MPMLWEGDSEISMSEAGRLIEGQFPALVPARLEPFGVGWDNIAFLVNGNLVFRFPRRKIGAKLIVHEARVLPLLAPRLALPIPLPSLLGRPEEAFPHPFAGYTLIPGTTACRVDWTAAARGGLAVPLARFLASLHAIVVEDGTVEWAPLDELGRANIVLRAPTAKQRLCAISRLQRGVDVPLLLELVDSLTGTPAYAGPMCWVHGDLYARHLLVDDAHDLCGVIDWGDVHLGDPALDLAIAFSFLPPSARDMFRRAYGQIDDATWRRARFRAISHSAVLVEYGADIGDDAIRATGEYGLQAAAM